jgi:DNA-binding NarL/FixJ family response regulator
MSRFLFIGCRTELHFLAKAYFSGTEILKAESLDAGLALLQQDRFIDLVLADADPFECASMDALKSACAAYPDVRFAILSDKHSRECVFSSLAGGFRGVISKRQSDEDAVAAMRQILAGDTYIPWSSMVGRTSAETGVEAHGRCAPGGARGDDLRLTTRQQQVLRLLSLGMSNKEIARALHIAESTTKIHTAMLMRALGVRNRTEAAFKAGSFLRAAGLDAAHAGAA